MRTPIRKSEILRRTKEDNGPIHLTKHGLKMLEGTLTWLKSKLPAEIEEVRRTGEYGDFSENVEYQVAKHKMRRTRNRIMSVEDQLKRIIVIKKDESLNVVQLGSTVVLDREGSEVKYEIVGPRETDPTKGRISHISPLGVELMGKKAGEEVSIKTPKGENSYKIISIK